MNKRIALITGATGTLGKAIAYSLITKNIEVVLLSKDIKKLEKLYDEVISVAAYKPTIIPLDLSHGRSIDKLGGEIYKKFRHLDILVSCSSYFPKLSPINHITPKDFNKIVNINITANWQLIRALDPLLRLSNYGRAYFLTCKEKTYSEPYFSAYSLTSSSVESMIKNWQSEINKTNIKVNTFDPGPVLSPLRKSAFPGEDKKKLQTPQKAANKLINLLEKSYKN
jgi:short-subunit dehydrogenase